MRCGDCSQGTPYCGYEKCNKLGCSCGHRDGRPICREGTCSRGRRDTELDSPITSAEDIIRVGDINGDGALSVDEAASFLEKQQQAANYTVASRAKRTIEYQELLKLDRNNDGLLSAEEIDF